MQEFTKSHKARLAIRVFKTTVDALALRGYYKPSGKSGQTLVESLKTLSPEIYGTIINSRIIELKGLEYAIDRLPKGIESCTRIILTAQEELESTSFEKIEPLKRRRTSYRIGEKEMCFVITRGLSEIYDVLSHLTFISIEADKIKNQIKDKDGSITLEWRRLETVIQAEQELSSSQLDQAIWNLSIILGRTYQETRQTYEYLEKNRKTHNNNHGLFQIIYALGKRAAEEEKSKDDMILIYFTPSLRDMIGHHKYGQKWARTIKEKLCALELQDRPLHIISANLHSVMNVIYGYAALRYSDHREDSKDVYEFFKQIRTKENEIKEYAQKYGLYELPDNSGSHIDCQIIDTALLESVPFHPELRISLPMIQAEKPVLLIMDYAFGTQAFEVMDELLGPYLEVRSEKLEVRSEKSESEITLKSDDEKTSPKKLNVHSISIMGKAGILPGKKGDIMLATAHVLEGTPHNYFVYNELRKRDFDKEDLGDLAIYKGPLVTVLGTSLQNKDVLERFQTTSWKAVGLEMEGGHYHRAISAAIIRGHISCDVKIRYAYYASDNPLISGQTLASGSMGAEGIRPTYMITKIIIEKILNFRSDTSETESKI